MVVVITGGAGFLGSALAEVFAPENTVYVIDVNPLPSWFPVDNVEYICADVSEFSNFFECDLLLHTASPVGPVGILSAGGEIGSLMVQSVKQVIRWSLSVHARLIFVSSSEVYGRRGRLSEDSGCVVGSYDPSIRNEYAQAKLLSEIMVCNTAKLNPGFSYQIVRPFNIAGPRQLPEKGFVLPRFTIQALSGRPLTVYGDGSQRRAFTHVQDVARGIKTAATAERAHQNSVWNIGCPDNSTTVRGLAEMVCSAAGSGSIEYCDPRNLHGRWFSECEEKLPDISRAQSLLGWSPAIPLGDIVAQSVEFWKNQNRYKTHANLV